MNIPIAAFTGLTSVVYFLVSKFNYETESFLKIIFLTLIFLAISVLLITLYYLLRAYSDIFRGYNYSNIPFSEDLNEHNKNLRNYYETYFNDADKGEKEFEIYLINKLTEKADFNNYINEKRHSLIYDSKQFLVIAVLLLILCLIPFGYNKMKLADKQTNPPSQTQQQSGKKNERCQPTDINNETCNDKPITNQNVIIIEGTNHKVKSITTKTKKEIYLDDQVILKDTCIKILKHK
jgi:hypothetical protein